MSVIVDFLKSIAGICQTGPLSPDSWQLEGNSLTVRLGDVPQLSGAGSAAYIEGKGLNTPVLIVRDEHGQFHCFANRCTHFGRKLDPVPGKRELRCCSLSHSIFDYQGKPVTGPARGPIQVYRTKLEGSNLIITIDP